MKSLCNDRAIECIRLYALSGRQVRDNGGLGIIIIDMQHITHCHSVTTESACIRIVPDFQHMAGNINPVSVQKLFDVVSIYGQPAVITKVSADGFGATQFSKVDCHLMYTTSRLLKNYSPCTG